jgi:hypothetical protein
LWFRRHGDEWEVRSAAATNLAGKIALGATLVAALLLSAPRPAGAAPLAPTLPAPTLPAPTLPALPTGPGVSVTSPPVRVALPPVQVALPPVQVALPPVQVALPPVQVALPPVDVGPAPVAVTVAPAGVVGSTPVSVPAPAAGIPSGTVAASLLRRAGPSGHHTDRAGDHETGLPSGILAGGPFGVNYSVISVEELLAILIAVAAVGFLASQVLATLRARRVEPMSGVDLAPGDPAVGVEREDVGRDDAVDRLDEHHGVEAGEHVDGVVDVEVRIPQ